MPSIFNDFESGSNFSFNVLIDSKYSFFGVCSKNFSLNSSRSFFLFHKSKISELSALRCLAMALDSFSTLSMALKGLSNLLSYSVWHRSNMLNQKLLPNSFNANLSFGLLKLLKSIGEGFSLLRTFIELIATAFIIGSRFVFLI